MSSKISPDEIKAPGDRPFEEEPVRWRMGLRQLLYLVFYSALFCWLMTVVVEPVLIGLLVLLIGGVLIVIAYVARRRSTQQDALLAILVVAAERDMPLAPAMDALSDRFTGNYRRKVRALAHDLMSGVSLSDALDREPGTLSQETEVLVRVGSEVGTLAGALREAGTTRLGLQPVWRGVVSRIGYFVWILFIMQGTSGFLFYYVLPNYQAILADFGITPPPPTLFMMDVGRHIRDWALLYVFLMFCEFVVMCLLFMSLTGWSPLNVPLVDRCLIRRHTALILRSLAWVVQGGFPITRGLEMLNEWSPSSWVRSRIARVLQDVLHGSDWVDSLTYHGLLTRSDAAVLESAKRAGNLPWALRETALSSERRLAYRLQALLQLLTPIVLIALGALVALFCAAYFAPLITILEVLA